GQAGAALAPHNQEDGMRGLRGGLGMCALAGLGLLAAAARADDKKADKPRSEKIGVDKGPQKGMGAGKGRFPGAKITSVEKETTGSKVMYDIELTLKGRKYEMDILEDGTVLEVEKEVDARDLPEAVSKALKARYPKATVKVIMEVNKVKGKK